MSEDAYSCDACRMDGTVREAVFFCPDCKDYMCASCETYHKKVKITRLHTLLSGERMPKKKVVLSGTQAEIPTNASSAAEDFSYSEDISTPAEEEFSTWESTEAEENPSHNYASSKAEALVSGKAKARRTFLDAGLAPHTSVNIINIKHSSDKYEPLVTGLSFLTNGEILLADYNNKALKLLDSSLKMKQTLICPAIPYDVAILNDKEAIATFPLQRNVLQFLKIYPSLQLGKSIQMNNGCWGVVVSKGKIYIACNANGHREEVLVLDLSGQTQQVFDIARLVEKFGDLKHIAANPKGDKLYLTGTAQVLCMTVEGKVVFTCSYSVLGGPRGILVDAEDNAMVCCHGTNKVLIINSDGKKNKVLLSGKDGLQDPKAIAFRNRDGLLVVGGWKRYNLLVFKLS